MTFILAEAKCDGDYIPNNGLCIYNYMSMDKLEQHIFESIKQFLNDNCLLNPNSGELQITDFMWDDPHEIDEPKHVKNVDEFMDKVKEMKGFKVYTDDDNSIELKWKVTLYNTSVKISYNMAPNRNSWAHVNYKFFARNE